MSKFLTKFKISQYSLKELINNVIQKVSNISKSGDKSKVEENQPAWEG